MKRYSTPIDSVACRVAAESADRAMGSSSIPAAASSVYVGDCGTGPTGLVGLVDRADHPGASCLARAAAAASPPGRPALPMEDFELTEDASDWESPLSSLDSCFRDRFSKAAVTDARRP